MVEFAVGQQRQLVIHQVGQIGQHGFQTTHREGDVATVEIAAIRHQLGLAVDQRIIVGAVQLILDIAAHPERIE